MMISRILVPVRDDGKAELVLRHAISLAQGYHARIIVTHCRARPEDLLPFGVPIPREMKAMIMSQSSSVLNIEEKAMRDLVAGICEEKGVAVSGKPSAKSVSAHFIEEEGRQIDVVRRHGRLADIIVVAKPDIDRNLGANTLKTALFHTGRPVIMCADTMPAEGEIFTRHLGIAWDGSLESSRAVALSLGMLKAADKVSILTVDNGHIEIEPDALKTYLAEHDIKADVIKAEPASSIGLALMEAGDTAGCGMTILGAYGNSAYLERAIGGVTQYFVDHAQKPVVLVH